MAVELERCRQLGLLVELGLPPRVGGRGQRGTGVVLVCLILKLEGIGGVWRSEFWDVGLRGQTVLSRPNYPTESQGD